MATKTTLQKQNKHIENGKVIDNLTDLPDDITYRNRYWQNVGENVGAIVSASVSKRKARHSKDKKRLTPKGQTRPETITK